MTSTSLQHSISSLLGLTVGDDLSSGKNRKAVAVIGDGAFPSGIVYEAMNHAGGLDKDLIVILNDNQMSICPRVGGLAKALDKARMTPAFHDAKRSIDDFVAAVNEGGASAVAAGSLFVFVGPHRAVLINYPERRVLEDRMP